jgi:hypothetical protein
MNGVRIPKNPSGIPIVALGFAVAPIVIGLAVKGYKAARKQAVKRFGKFRDPRTS